MKENLGLSEGIEVAVNEGRRQAPPRAGTIEYIVYDDSGRQIFKDVVPAADPAPRRLVVAGVPATFFDDGRTGLRYQEAIVPLDADITLIDVPEHVKRKSEFGGTLFQIRWSCDE